MKNVTDQNPPKNISICRVAIVGVASVGPIGSQSLHASEILAACK